ncbi:ctp synthase [Trichoderma cornu-damae]|uniref:CTP synthase n=1 Tax=Trichoderma cornu-damae TaxID=654480 RepID=A0A9P8QI80_9HYPO|nr:ctp synthase [Trichoderma cornu-damae]
MRYILVSGGVISGVGKGIIASSTGLLLKTLGLRVTCIKIDPYLNIDAGTMNPKDHGECFVLDDGGECDLDLGHYQRYLGINLSRDHNITTGKINMEVGLRERRGDYLGRTVQVVPHVTNLIQEWIERVSRIPIDESGVEPDVCIVELGGTVGDIENMPFVEALTQLRHKCGKGNFVNIQVSYVPVINGEQKTKPTQHAVKSIRSAGLIPDLIACRCERPLEQDTINKIALHCQVEPEQVIAVRDMPTVYQVPLLLKEQGLPDVLRSALMLDNLTPEPSQVKKGAEIWQKWKDVISQTYTEKVDIALVGKYVELHDSYLSLYKSLEHAAIRCKRRLNLIWVDSEHLEDSTREASPALYHKAWHDVCSASGVVVPGGFGERATEGIIKATQWAREHNTPWLGICFGMQLAVCEFARNVCGHANATSEEFDEQAEHPVIIFMPEGSRASKGGTMRLGLRTTHFQPGSEDSKLRAMYGNADVVDERHRHRYEVNPAYVDELEKAGLSFIGKDETGRRMEIIELKDHPWFVGVQYHPEYLSQPLSPSLPILGLVAAALGCLDQVTKEVCLERNLANGLADGTA